MNSKEDLAKKYNDLLNDIYELENSVKATKHSGEAVLKKIISEKKVELSRLEKQLVELNKTVNEKDRNQEEKINETIKTSSNYSLTEFDEAVSNLRKLLIIAGMSDLAYYLDAIYCYNHRDVKNFAINETKIRASEEQFFSEDFLKNDIIGKIKNGKQILKDFPEVAIAYSKARIIIDRMKAEGYIDENCNLLVNTDKLEDYFIFERYNGLSFYSEINSQYNKKSTYGRSERILKKIKQANEERLKNKSQYLTDEQENASKLAKYLRTAGLGKLAVHLEMLCMAKAKSDDIKHKVNIELDEEALQNGKLFTTKREYREIRSRVVTLSRQATRMMKKYVGLRRLYQNAGAILEDMKAKKVISNTGYDSIYAIEKYFTDYRGNSLGYELLEFYRDYESKYREDEFNHRI